MKKIIIILLLTVSIFSTACSQNENKDTPNKNESSQEEKELIFTEEKSDIVDGSHMYELFDKLASYGREIYKNEEYIKYSKKDGAYFISLKELSKKCNVVLDGLYSWDEYKILKNKKHFMYKTIETAHKINIIA